MQLLSLDFTPSTVNAGSNINQVSWFLLNNGPDTLSQPTFYFDFYLSRNTAAGDADDIKIDSVSIPNPLFNWPPGSAAQQIVGGIHVPSTASGNYYLVGFINPIGTDPNTNNNYSGSLQFLSVNGPPIISVPPTNKTVLEGQNAVFAVQIEGAGPMQYQWYKDGIPVAIATNAVLTLVNAQQGDAGNYSVTVSNTSGSSTTDSVRLVIQQSPINFALFDARRTNSTFSVSFPTITNRTYVLQYKNALSDAAWTAVAALTGDGTVRTLADPTASAPRRFYRVIVAGELVNSFYSGDSYLTASGEARLYRSSTTFFVRATDVNAVQQLTGAGGPLNGSTTFFQVGTNLDLYQPPQSASPGVTVDSYFSTMSTTTLQLGTGDVQPVFVDPKSGLLMIPTDEIIVCLQVGVDAQTFFGTNWANVRPLSGTSDQFVEKVPGATASQMLGQVNIRASQPGAAWAAAGPLPARR